MKFRFEILGSSSSGNCGLLETSNGCFLIDAGFSAKQIAKCLIDRGKKLEDIKGVFLTHEHTDHCAGIRGLSHFQKIKFFANEKTALAIEKKFERKLNWEIFETNHEFLAYEMIIKSFSIPHDAYDPVGFYFGFEKCDKFYLGIEECLKEHKSSISETKIEHSMSKDNHNYQKYSTLAWVTDLGHIPENVSQIIRSVDVLVLEANHDIDLLRKDQKRPWSVKQRVLSRHGHLSNDETFEFIEKSKNDNNWKKIYLAHLSSDCNNPDIVCEMFNPFRSNNLNISVIEPCKKLSFN